jgi:hypothetical protein
VLFVSLPELGRLAYEFLDEECFADMIEENLDLPTGDVTLTYHSFEAEGTIWD